MRGSEKMLPRKLCVCLKNGLLFIATFILVTIIVKHWPLIHTLTETVPAINNRKISIVPGRDTADRPKQNSPPFDLDQNRHGRLDPKHNKTYVLKKPVRNKPVISEIKNSSHWQRVDNSKDLFVFSAYFYEPENMIRVVGIGLREKEFDVKCVFKEDGTTEQLIVPGNVTEIGEHHEKRYTALFVLCPLPTDNARPSTVTITTATSGLKPHTITTATSGLKPHTITTATSGLKPHTITTATSGLKPHTITTATSGLKPHTITTATSGLKPHSSLRIGYDYKLIESGNISVCIAPLHSGYSKVHELLQSVEMNRILGASKIFIYNESISNSVQHILRYYQRAGIVDIVQWNVPFRDSKLIHYHGQMAFIHDCWLRNRGLFKFVAFNDLDELIIPYKYKNWSQMLSSYLIKNPNIGSFMFKNSFFDKQKDDFQGLALNETQTIKDLNLHMMAMVWREKKIWKYNHRSKFILMPKRVYNIGIHRVYGHIKGFKEVVVDPNIAILHHYKGFKLLKTEEKVRDDSVRNYKKQLIERIKHAYQNTIHVKERRH